MAVVGSVGRRLQIIDASDAANRHGIYAGLTLAEAKALYPNLVCLDHDPAADRSAIEALGRWMTRFTPSVATSWKPPEASPASDDTDPPPVLLLNITGCERLFGGIARLVDHVKRSVHRFGIPAHIAVAPTVGAAWAFASAGKTSGQIVEARQLIDALRPLPITALRLRADIVAAVHHLGLTSIGQLLALPRDQLPARFGSTLLARLDQASGARPEPLVPLGYEVPIAARMELDDPADSLEAIWAIFDILLRQVVDDLARRGRGAKQLDLICRSDRTSRRPDVIKPIQLCRPTRKFSALFNLVRCAAERMDGGTEGFVCFHVKVPLHERISDEQAELVQDDAREENAELDRLIERLRVRLGDAAVIRPMLVESHLPELAWKPAGDAPAQTVVHPLFQTRSRPLHLLKMPAEINVIAEPSNTRTGRPRQFVWQGRPYRLQLIVGPERISGEWWRGHDKTRDYYEVEDEQGRRFWIFRVASRVEDSSHSDRWRLRFRWFLHGLFA